MCILGHQDYEPSCFRCRIESVNFAPSATGNARAQTVNQTDKNWSKDHDAYRRLRLNGIQPMRIDGSAQLEAKASTQREIEHGYLYTSPEQKKSVEAAFQTVGEFHD